MSSVMWLLLFTIVLSVTCGLDPSDWPDPPLWTDKPKTARYLVHYADWGVVSALSPEYQKRAFGTLQSYADGTLGNSTGVPYFYISSMSDTYKNVQYCNQVTLALSEVMSTYCQKKGYDAEEPVCARLTVVGDMVPVVDPSEQVLAKNALFKRHPAMSTWPTSHGWKFYKMKIEALHLIDFFGGASHVSVEDYFATSP